MNPQPSELWKWCAALYDLAPGEVRVPGRASNGEDLVQPVYWCPWCGGLLSVDMDEEMLYVDRRGWDVDLGARLECACASLQGPWDMTQIEAGVEQ